MKKSVLRVSTALVVALFCICYPARAQAQQASGLQTPEQHLGRPLGADFELADWDEVSNYHLHLGAHSPHVITEVVGQSTEGRDFLLATISSEQNLADLEQHKLYAKQLSDPRGVSEEQLEKALSQARPILFISLGMHSTETSPPQFGMELAHLLATSQEEPYRSVRENLIVNLIVCTNPDGLDHVVDWYRETVGTPHEASSLLKLYQYYTGHDNNRDWFALTQKETQIVTRLLYSEWFPQVYWDVHEQGSTRERFFVPPFRDPLNPNLDPSVITGIGLLGARALDDMTNEGLTGISTGVSYDMWWNGGNRNVPVRHNIIGLLTEAAGVDLATPIFLPRRRLSAPRGLGEYGPSNRFPDPWPGGWWRIRDIIDYEHSFARSLLGSVAREPRLWLERSLRASQRALEHGRNLAPRGWVIPSDNRDPGAVRRLLEILELSGVELWRSAAAFEIEGRSWPAGSIVIPSEQPYGAHVKDLFELQRYPEGEQPYDVAGWTLPLLLGVHRVELVEELPSGLEAVQSIESALDSFGEVELLQDSDDWRELFLLSKEGKDKPESSWSDREKAFDRLATFPMPRVGVYAPWSGSMDEGWLRWVLDDFGLEYVTVRNEMLRAGQLDQFLDVLVLPSLSPTSLDKGRAPGSVPGRYARGLDPDGAVAINEFVRTGGSLVALGRSSQWAIDLFSLSLIDVTREDSAGDFACPGSVLRTELVKLKGELPQSPSIFFSRSAAWRMATDAERGEQMLSNDHIEVYLRFPAKRILASGWIQSAEVLANRAAWAKAEVDDGQVHLFGFSPHYRGWSQQSFHLLFHAISEQERR